MSSRKRSRFTEPRFFRGPKRQVEKIQKLIALTPVGTAQEDLLLYTVVDPVTVGGFIWGINTSAVVDPASGPALVTWAIIVSREGITVGTLGIGNGSDVYTPGENVIVGGMFNVGDIALGTSVSHEHSGKTKTMRKLKGGDTVHFIARGVVATQQVTASGVITFFAKH